MPASELLRTVYNAKVHLKGRISNNRLLVLILGLVLIESYRLVIGAPESDLDDFSKFIIWLVSAMGFYVEILGSFCDQIKQFINIEFSNCDIDFKGLGFMFVKDLRMCELGVRAISVVHSVL